MSQPLTPPSPRPSEQPEKKSASQWMGEHKVATAGIGCVGLVVLFFILAGVVGVMLGVDTSSSESSAGSSPSAVPSPSKSAEPSKPAGPSKAEQRAALVAQAEKAVAADLPAVPYWKGTTFKGVYLNSKKVCVDRTLANGTNAGYVTVTFPKRSLGEPLDGTCAQPAPKPVDYEGNLKSALSKELGKGNRDAKRLSSVAYNEDFDAVVVRWAINDNLTEGLIKKGAQLDLSNMLKVIQRQQEKGLVVKTATFAGTYSLQDPSGNVSEDRVVLAEYTGKAIANINFDNFLFKNVYVIADKTTISPLFRP